MRVPGFSLVIERDLPDIGGYGRLYRHSSGAEVLSLLADDPNRVFGIAFRTIPEESTGVAHILEHSVLCGSERYPLRKPFVELLKGSLQTYLNAVTMPDLTCYPVASPNEADFRNLVGVYLDAVFAPHLSAETFRQEAWRLEPDKDGTLSLHGVAYNEMKGYFSSPHGVLEESVRRALFPDTTYGWSYGGDWQDIPGLTHEALVAFHRRFYTPANALAFLSGPDEPEWPFEALDRYLSGPAAGPRPAPVTGQPAFAAPRQVRATYSGPQAEARRDGLVAVAWALDAGLDNAGRLRWRVLDRLLIGAPAAVLRRALVERGLGEDLIGGGFSDATLQPTFRVALSGADPARADEIEAAVLDCLRACVRTLPADAVEAAINTVEFRLREGAAGSLPAGIHRMMEALATWRHGGAPLAPFEFAAEIDDLRARQSAGERPLEQALAALLETRHRVTAVLEADPALAARDAAAERARIVEMASAIGTAGTARLAADAEALRVAQERPDPPEALASLPVLRLADLPAEVPPDALQAKRSGRQVRLVQELPTRGIGYLDLGLDLAGLPERLLPAARLMGPALLQTGTATLGHVALAQRIGAATGGLVAEGWAANRLGGGHAARLFLRGKALAARMPDLCAILADVLRTARLDDAARLREVVLQEKARTEARLVPAGHDIVDRRLRAGLGAAGRADEAMNGATYLAYLRDAAARAPEALAGELEELRRWLLAQEMVCSVTADEVTQAAAAPAVSEMLAALGTGAGDGAAGDGEAARSPAAEALEVAAQVSFVGLGGDLHAAGLAESGAAEAAARYLANTWLWDRVRVQGGAYGAQCRFDPVSGGVTMLSYRDPNVLETLEVFRGAGAYLRRPPTERDLTSSIVATVGALDRPLAPGAQGFAALQRWLTGRDAAWRNARRGQLLGATPADFAAFGAALDAMAERVVVMGGRAALDAADAARPGWADRTTLS